MLLILNTHFLSYLGIKPTLYGPEQILSNIILLGIMYVSPRNTEIE